MEGERTLSYGEVQDLSWAVAGALARSGVAPGGKVGILSSNHAVAFACVFGIARRGAVWCPINPRNEASENRALLELFDCECLLYHSDYAEMVERIAPELPWPKSGLIVASSVRFGPSPYLRSPPARPPTRYRTGSVGSRSRDT